MPKRKLLPIDKMPLAGRRVCLDFVNTTGARNSGAPRERLNTYRDVIVWGRRVGVLTAQGQRALGSASRRNVPVTRAALRRILKARETLYRVLRAVAEKRPPTGVDLVALNRLWQQDRARRSLVASDHSLQIRLRASDDELDWLVWPVVESAIELLTSSDVVWLRRCGECDWLFVDESKNHTRLWCKKDCGDRVRARRHYQRSRRSTASA